MFLDLILAGFVQFCWRGYLQFTMQKVCLKSFNSTENLLTGSYFRLSQTFLCVAYRYVGLNHQLNSFPTKN